MSMCCRSVWVHSAYVYTFSRLHTPHTTPKKGRITQPATTLTPHVGVDHASLSVTPLSIRARGGDGAGGGRRATGQAGDRARRAPEREAERGVGVCCAGGRMYF